MLFRSPNFPNPQTVESDPAQHTLTAKTTAVQKAVADLTHPGSPRAGDTLEYTLTFQVSDYFALANFDLADVLTDGQAFDTTFTPTITYTQKSQTLTGAFAEANNVWSTSVVQELNGGGGGAEAAYTSAGAYVTVGSGTTNAGDGFEVYAVFHPSGVGGAVNIFPKVYWGGKASGVSICVTQSIAISTTDAVKLHGFVWYDTAGGSPSWWSECSYTTEIGRAHV